MTGIVLRLRLLDVVREQGAARSEQERTLHRTSDRKARRIRISGTELSGEGIRDEGNIGVIGGRGDERDGTVRTGFVIGKFGVGVICWSASWIFAR